MALQFRAVLQIMVALFFIIVIFILFNFFLLVFFLKYEGSVVTGTHILYFLW